MQEAATKAAVFCAAERLFALHGFQNVSVRDITAEADSGGHTDQRPLPVLVPLLLKLRVSDRGAEVRHALGPRQQRVARGLARLCVLICC